MVNLKAGGKNGHSLEGVILRPQGILVTTGGSLDIILSLFFFLIDPAPTQQPRKSPSVAQSLECPRWPVLEAGEPKKPALTSFLINTQILTVF